jgi:hypothetical protein
VTARLWRRLLLYALLGAVAVVVGFGEGVSSWDREFCTADATDCDLGFFRGVLWAGAAVAVSAVAIAATEVLLARRRRTGQSV